MRRSDAMNLQLTERARGPPHGFVFHIVERLPWTFKQRDRSTEGRRREVISGPEKFAPGSLARLRKGMCDPPQLSRHDLAHNLHLLADTEIQQPTQALTIVVDLPFPAHLGVLSHPGIKNRKQRNLFALGFELQNHLLANVCSGTHP